MGDTHRRCRACDTAAVGYLRQHAYGPLLPRRLARIRRGVSGDGINIINIS